MEVKISWIVYIQGLGVGEGVPPLPSRLNPVCIQSSKYEGLRQDSNFQDHGKEVKKTQNEIDS